MFRFDPHGSLVTLKTFPISDDVGGPTNVVVGGNGQIVFGDAPKYLKSHIFNENPANGQYRSIYTYPESVQNRYPNYLVEGRDGLMFGTNLDFFQDKTDNVSKIDNEGNGTILHTFAGGNDGYVVEPGLVISRAGDIYGATLYGGSEQDGTIFRLSPDGKETLRYNFTGGSGGTNPNGLIADAAGNLYGNAAGGTGVGLVFKFGTDFKETVLYSFLGNQDGGFPVGQLTRDSAGNLYGVTQDYGSSTLGHSTPTIFKLSPTGYKTTLYVFPSGTAPNAPLLVDAHGSLFGVTGSGGTYGLGAIFRLDP